MSDETSEEKVVLGVGFLLGLAGQAVAAVDAAMKEAIERGASAEQVEAVGHAAGREFVRQKIDAIASCLVVTGANLNDVELEHIGFVNSGGSLGVVQPQQEGSGEGSADSGDGQPPHDAPAARVGGEGRTASDSPRERVVGRGLDALFKPDALSLQGGR